MLSIKYNENYSNEMMNIIQLMSIDGFKINIMGSVFTNIPNQAGSSLAYSPSLFFTIRNSNW